MPHKLAHVHAHQHHKHLPPAHVTAFISAHAAEAKIVAMKFNLPASAILAQSALESKWGMKAPGNAFFGVKGKSPAGTSVMIPTHEVIKGKVVAETDAFRSYDSWASAADDYANVITTNKLFASVLASRTDPFQYADAMGRSPYATGHAYGDLMKSIITAYNLTQYDK
jgi:flagellum-specific peptidoglycan hydrolase FlgJ